MPGIEPSMPPTKLALFKSLFDRRKKQRRKKVRPGKDRRSLAQG